MKVIGYKCVLGVSGTCFFLFYKLSEYKTSCTVEVTEVNVKPFSYAEGQATGIHGYFVLKMQALRYFKLILRQVFKDRQSTN